MWHFDSVFFSSFFCKSSANFAEGDHTQVNRMSRSRRVLATGGKQRTLGLDMVCIETILFNLDSL